MPNDPSIPRELQHLLEKRETPDRRQRERRKPAGAAISPLDRRVSKRRKKTRRKK